MGGQNRKTNRGKSITVKDGSIKCSQLLKKNELHRRNKLLLRLKGGQLKLLPEHNWYTTAYSIRYGDLPTSTNRVQPIFNQIH